VHPAHLPRRDRRGAFPERAADRFSDRRGLPLPGHVRLSRGTTSKRLAAAPLQAFCENWGTVDLRYAKSKNLTPYDVLTIASMVEKETLAPSERPLVAAVIYNRLHARMPLGIDATLRYGLHIAPTQSILESQLQSDNPYNTRKLSGLPPTPIANPGLASIQAAAHPAKVDYLYFVRKPDRVHHFFTASERHSPSTSARTGTAVDRARRPARSPGRGIALTPHAERRLRGRWSPLALRGLRRRGRRRRRTSARDPGLRGRQRHDPAQAGRGRGV